MKPGTRVAGRWRVEDELGGDEEVRRFRVRDGDTVAEAVVPTLHALLRPGVRESFLSLRLPEHPAALPTLATDLVDGVPVRVRPVTTGTLAAPDARLSAVEAARAVGWLAPAVLAAGGAGLGELGPEDLVRDADGVLRLAPTGVPRAESLARAPRHRAPEGAATPEADLFGLGVTLYRAVTGSWPTEGRAPASAHGAGAEADALLAALTSPDPAARRAAVAGLAGEPVRVDLPAAPEAARSAAASASARPGSPVRTTVASPAAAPLPLGRDLPPYAVLVPLRGLSPAALRVLAARSAADPEALRRAQARGATWNVDTTTTEAEAGRIQARLAAAGVPGARVALTTVPKVVQLFLLGLVGGGLGVITGFPLVGLGLAALFFWLAAANLRAMFATVETRSAVAERARAALPADTPEARVRALRRRVADAPLPGIVLADLRADVARLEDRLDELRELQVELEGATAADLQARRARVTADLAAFDTAVAASDENLTRALTQHAEERAATPRVLPEARLDGQTAPPPAPAEAEGTEGTEGPRRPPPSGVTR